MCLTLRVCIPITRSMGRRILSAVLWSIGTFICIVLIIVIPYGEVVAKVAIF